MVRRYNGFIIPILIVMMFIAPAFQVLGTGSTDGASSSSRQDKNEGNLGGFITEKDNGPLPGATIRLSSTTSLWAVKKTTSGSNGAYSLTVLPGDYNLKVTKDTYFEFTTIITIYPDEELRYDVELVPIPPISSAVKGIVRNQATSTSLWLASVTLYDVVRNYTVIKFSNLLGGYNIPIYSGNFLIISSKDGFLPKYFGGVVVKDNQDVILDINLEPLPPMNAKIVGDVKDDQGMSVTNASVIFLDTSRSYLGRITADVNGHYDIDLYGSSFLVMAMDPSSTRLGLGMTNVTALSGSSVNGDLLLKELPPSSLVSDVNFTAWSTGEVTMDFTSWGRGWPTWGMPMQTIRLLMDVYMGDGDFYASATEVDPWIEYYLPILKNDLKLHSTYGTFTIDGIDYIFEDDYDTIDIDMEGSVFSTKPITIHLTISSTANGTIDQTLPTHSIWLLDAYDSSEQDTETYYHFDDQFSIENISKPAGYLLEETAPGNIHVDSPVDPDPDDSTWAIEVAWDLVDRIPPQADAGSHRTVNEDVDLQFNGSASTDNFGIASYNWSFGDGTFENLTVYDTTHIYQEPGNYTVTLKVIDLVGWEDEVQIWVDVLDVTPPTIEIIHDNLTFKEDVAVKFTSNATDNVAIASIQWTIDGSVMSNTSALEHVFEEPGTYLIEVHTFDTSGLQAWHEIEITITDETPPVADAGPSRTTDEGQELFFDAANSTDNVGITDYDWNFGDGSTNVSGSTTSHKYDTPGVYNVTLNVTDGAGHADTDVLKVTVLDATPPVAEISVDNTSVLKRTQVLFSANRSTDNVGIVGYEWEFGDGAKSIGEVAKHTYERPGSYNVTLKVTDDRGLVGSRVIVIEVMNPPRTIVEAVNPLWLVAIVAIMFAAGIGTVFAYRRLKYGGYSVDEVFVIYRDGRLIKHISHHGIETVDKEILASMLTAVQDFVKESFKQEGGSLGKLEYGKDTKIIIEKGIRVYLALVVKGHDPESLRPKLQKAVDKLESDYFKELDDWEGDLDIFEDMDNVIKGFIKI